MEYRPVARLILSSLPSGHSCHSIPNCIRSRAIRVHTSPGLFWVVGLKVFLSEGLSLRAAFRVFLTNTRDGTPNDGRSSLTPGRNGKTWGGGGGSLWGHDQGCPPVTVQAICSGEWNSPSSISPLLAGTICLTGWSCSLLNFTAWVSSL